MATTQNATDDATHGDTIAPEEYGLGGDKRSVAVSLCCQYIHRCIDNGTLKRPLHVGAERLPDGHNY